MVAPENNLSFSLSLLALSLSLTCTHTLPPPPPPQTHTHFQWSIVCESVRHNSCCRVKIRHTGYIGMPKLAHTLSILLLPPHTLIVWLRHDSCMLHPRTFCTSYCTSFPWGQTARSLGWNRANADAWRRGLSDDRWPLLILIGNPPEI